MFNSKKKFFKDKVTSVTKQIWDMEFKVEKTLQIREGIRQDRDKLVDARHNIEAALKAKSDDEKLLKEFEKVTDTIKRYEAQMTMLDNQINGVPAEGDNPGENGINDTISSLAELRQMYLTHIKKL